MTTSKKIQVIYFGGTFGNLLRWVLDRFSPDCQFKNLYDPWDKDNRVHKRDERKLYNKKFIRGHQADDGINSPDIEADKIVINFNASELLFVSRCGFYRGPGNETEQGRYHRILKRSNIEQLKLFNINKDAPVKMVAKELCKIQLHDHNNNVWWNAMFKFMLDSKNYQFPINSLWNKHTFIDHLKKISDKFNLNLEINEIIIDNITKKIKKMYVIETKDRAKEVYYSIQNKKNIDCSELDIWEQAWIEVLLEKQYDSLIFPYGTNWFDSTGQINEFIATYPSYLRHMNPRLPWYNSIKNPYYLTGKIDK